MKQFPRLYKRGAGGAVRIWHVEVTRLLDDYYDITRTSGQLHGQYISVHDFVTQGVNIGKANETTPEWQAQFNAQSYWNKQKDNGYKTLEELGIHGGDSQPGLLALLRVTLPEYNTDATGNVKPMLANRYKPAKLIYPWFAQPKLDGIRSLMTVRNSEVTFRTRSGKLITTLEHISNALIINPEDDYILDGEVYSDEITFQDISSAFKAYNEDTHKLKFRVYDIVNGCLQKDRLNHLCDKVIELNNPYIQLVETVAVNSDKQVKEFHDQMFELGHEGAMLRHPHGVYKQGARSSHMLKVKMFDEEEFELIGWELGKRGVQDLNGIVKLPNGKISKPTMMGTIAQKTRMYLDITFDKRHMLTVKFFGYTDEGKLRHPNGKAIRDYE